MDTELQENEYIISIAVLDPAGMLPSLRFAIENYFTGGRHPMGYVGINKTLEQYEINSSDFKNMYEDHSLKYIVNK